MDPSMAVIAFLLCAPGEPMKAIAIDVAPGLAAGLVAFAAVLAVGSLMLEEFARPIE